MRSIPITDVRFDGDCGVRLGLYLEPGESLGAVDRAGNSVRWDSVEKSLYMVPRDDGSARSPLEAFQQILAAAHSEYGVQLGLTPATGFQFVAPEDRGAIYAWHRIHAARADGRRADLWR